MKIVIFEPHPDDLLFGAGSLIFDLIKENHDIHVITFTDGEEMYVNIKRIKITPEELGKMRVAESKRVIEFLSLKKENHVMLHYPDGALNEHFEECIQKIEKIVMDADRLIIPSNNNFHVDHQAAHDIAILIAQKYDLDIEFWVFSVYGRYNEDSIEKQIQIEINNQTKQKLNKWFEIYQSQTYYKSFLKMFLDKVNQDTQIYGIFTLNDLGKYHNFK